jgi:hypothetical protein
MKACANCGVPLAEDQRYCLECGTRQLQARSQFLERFTPAAVGPGVSQSTPLAAGGRSANSTALAGIGVLLLAMGVGVLIGRASDGKGASGAPQVISVASSPATGAAAGSGAAPEAAGAAAGEVPEDWPAGKSGYTVQLQTFPSATAQASEVTTAKSAAVTKGATGVGVLLSSNFTSLPVDQYIVYSGDYGSEAQAKQALDGLKSKFSTAAVIRVSGASATTTSPAHSATGSGSSGAGKTGGSGGGASQKSSSSNSTHSAEQKSLSLPNVVTTG